MPSLLFENKLCDSWHQSANIEDRFIWSFVYIYNVRYVFIACWMTGRAFFIIITRFPPFFLSNTFQCLPFHLFPTTITTKKSILFLFSKNLSYHNIYNFLKMQKCWEMFLLCLKKHLYSWNKNIIMTLEIIAI